MTGDARTPPAAEPSEAAQSRDRLVTLSDGVFAIAITLLVLDVVPKVASTVRGMQLVYELLDMAPRLAAYLLSFLVIGRFWDAHRAFFGAIGLADTRVVWANLAVLPWITLIPATAALLGSHLVEPAAIALYAINLLLVVTALGGLWRAASTAGCVRPEPRHERAGSYIYRYVAVSLVGYTLAALAAFLSPVVGLVLVLLTTILARAIANRILVPKTAAA